MIFLDTCILIDYSKNSLDLNFDNDYCINSVVSMEFKVGALNKLELNSIKQILSQINLIQTNQDVFDLADKLVEKYALSHNMSIYDGVIAATCLIYDLTLWTHNIKDFHYIDNLKLKY
jgi:predicted nucleic acid-binding protein